MRLAFMGTPDFAVPTLARLIESAHEIVAVYTQPPRPYGRGYGVRQSAVHLYAEERGLKVFTPPNFKDFEDLEKFEALELDCAVVIAYGLILPRSILEAPRLGCLNVHASLLPRWRGAAPIQRALMAGDSDTGITIMKIEEKLDAGPIYMQLSTPISERTTSGDLHQRLAEMGAKALLEVVNRLDKEELSPTSQNDEAATHAPKILTAEERLDWRKPSSELNRQVRALNPWPGAWFEHEGKRIKVWQASSLPLKFPIDVEGAIVGEDLTVSCGARGSLEGLRLEVVQRAGGKPLSAKEFLKGYPLKLGDLLPIP